LGRTASDSEPATVAVGGKLGKYDLVAELGHGSYGVVYKGFDPFVQRDVAIKVAHGRKGASSEQAQAQAQAAFFAEARAAGKLTHPYIVVLYDAGVEGEYSYLVMELVEGDTLRRYCTGETPRPKLERVADLMLKCSLALDYVHKNGVLHKDIKPGNIMVTRDGTPKIMDFGIAAMTLAASGPTRSVAGSPMYMSPEQLGGKALTAASDLYSLGTVMYQLLTGEQPFQARDTKALFQQIRSQAPPRLRDKRKDVPEEMAAIVERLMAKDAAARFQTGRELAEALAPLTDARLRGGKRKALVMSQESLKGLHFFKAFRSGELRELMDASTTATYKVGEHIIREGETDNALYILLMGLAEVRKGAHLITLLEKGDCFGEIGFLYAVKRTASVVATTDVMVLKVNAALLEQMSEECQLNYYKIFCENLILRLTLTTEKAARLAPRSDLALDFILP
jgi:eukaryotic-like serine/threonine-protein kinase